jgi:serpin B
VLVRSKLLPLAFLVLASPPGMLLSGCSRTSGPGEATGEARSSLTRDLSPSVAAADQTALEEGNASFALSAFAALFDVNGNLALSPYSLSSALAMTYAGARGSTASEIATALDFTLPQARLHPAFDWLDLQLASRANVVESSPSSNPRPFALHIANSIWENPQSDFEEPFLDTLAVDYGAGVELTDLADNPAGATAAINAWTSQETNGRIANLLPPGAVDSNTMLVLVDALYFDAGWVQPFDKSQTGPGAFTRTDGTTVQATMMSEAVTLPYASGSGYQVVELSYEGGMVAMDIVLPTAGTEVVFEAGLTSQVFTSVIASLQPTAVGLSLPKLNMQAASSSVAAMLEKLGVQTAFTPLADFTGMTSQGGIFIKNVFHEAFVVVDEDGTEAAAATSVVFEDGSVNVMEAEMNVDHPFFFAIRDLPTGTILFMGWVADPTM